MNDVKHPKAIAIAKRGENCLWDMGDYINEVIVRSHNYHDKSGERLKEIADELTAHGFDYSAERLRKLRDVALAFPSGSREPDLSWAAHQAAGTPEMLKSVVIAARAANRKTVGRNYVKAVVRSVDADRRAVRQGKAARASAAAEKADAKGDREKAEALRAKAAKLKGAPKRKKPKIPAPEVVGVSTAKAKFSADIAEIASRLRKAGKDIEPHIPELSKAFVVGSVEELLQLAEAARKLAEKLNPSKHRTLYAVA